MPDHPVLTAAAQYRAALLALERQAATRLVQAYGRAYARMGEQIDVLSQAISALPDPDRASVLRLSALRSLQRQVVDEINRYAIFADTEIANAATSAIQAGLLDSRGLVEAYFTSAQGKAAVRGAFDILAVEQVETMLGFLADDSPLHQALVNKLGPAVANRMADALVDGIVLGMNPRRVAEIVRRELGVGLSWSLTTSRTAMIWSYREATRANYVANRDIVTGWIWFASLDSRVCMSCVAQHGSRHDVTEVLNDHHNGRCVALPDVPLARRVGVPLPDVTAGEMWFRALPEEKQQGIMGPGMWDAYRSGAFAFGDLSQAYEDPIYGQMLREASLKGILGERAKEFYRRP